jgi:hypothetical protein
MSMNSPVWYDLKTVSYNKEKVRKGVLLLWSKSACCCFREVVYTQHFDVETGIIPVRKGGEYNGVLLAY